MTIWIIVVCLLASMLLAAMEAAILTVNRARLHDTRYERDRVILLRLLQKPERVLASVILLSSFFNLLALLITAMMVTAAWGPFGYVITFILALPAYWLIELLSKSIGRFFPYRFLRVLWPLVFVLYYVPGSLYSAFGLRSQANERDPGWLDQERATFRHLTDVIESEGTLTSRSKQLILGILQLSSTRLDTIMTPIKDVEVVQEHTPVRTALRIADREGRDAVPVRDSAGRVSSWMAVRDALNDCLRNDRAGDYARPGWFLPPSANAAMALQQLRAGSTPIGFVANEASVVIGVVYLESIIAQLLRKEV